MDKINIIPIDVDNIFNFIGSDFHQPFVLTTNLCEPNISSMYD